MNLEPLTLLSANCFLFGALSLVSDQVYRYFKFSGSPDGVSFCFYDNFFYGWYYLICTVYYLLMGAFLMKAQNVSPKRSVWRVAKAISLFTFFAECEAILQFIFVSRDIEYQVEELIDQQMVYAFVLLGVLRWSVSLFALNHTSLALEQIVQEHYGYSVTGSGFTANRYRLNLYYGWVTQYFVDYVTLHYLAYNALYCPRSFAYVLASDQFYSYKPKATLAARASYSALFVLFGLFYARFARKEITLFNYII